MDELPTELAVYVHWPYCTRICPYCDFNVYKARKDHELVEAIIQDLEHWRNLGGSREITSVHFGGGTPSLLSPKNTEAIITKISQLWVAKPDIEVAIEANPNDHSWTHWHNLQQTGVNRLSLGVQSFHDPALKLLGRDHDSDIARKSLEVAVTLFPAVSLDLIFGWREQTQALWEDDLEIAIQSGAQHISTYQLTIEPETAFAKMEARGQIKSMEENTSAEFYDTAIHTLAENGFEHYEVSNFARKTYRSRHNMAYWRGQDYVGVGPGAHGRLTVKGNRIATIAELRPDDYKQAVRTIGHGISEQETLTSVQRAEEYIMMGLRISEGISLETYTELSGTPPDMAKVNGFLDEGYLTQTNGRISTTPKGRLVLNYITEKLLT